MIWTFRLGSFLFWRVLKDGEDKRFRSILPNFSQLFMTWMLSATWVFIQSLTALVAITTLNKADFGLLGALGLFFWVMGFSVEVVADNQKTKFRSDPKNKDKFITTGLWSLSRHPNYVGEIMLWIGISIMALPVLTGYQYGSLISPLFSFLLIYYVSGVRMLEARANKKWGNNEKYQEYKRNTPIFFPKIPK
jgi:steroid 5-alpha reductase family enzyme